MATEGKPEFLWIKKTAASVSELTGVMNTYFGAKTTNLLKAFGLTD
jgi:hypothetical protein